MESPDPSPISSPVSSPVSSPSLSPSPSPNIESLLNSMELSENQKSKAIELGITIAVVYGITRFVSPQLGIMIKRTTFFTFFAYIIVSAYALNNQKMKGGDNLVMQTEYLCKEISDYITNGQHLIKYDSLEDFIFALMEKHKHIYGIWMCFDDETRDNPFVYRNSGRKMTINVNSSKQYKKFKELDWYKRGVVMAENGEYKKGVWVPPFIDDKISRVILFPCVYPLVTKDSFLDGVMCCCFTLYKHDPKPKISKNTISKMMDKINNNI